MTTFKPTHKLDSGHLAELEHEFEGREYDGQYGLFYLVCGSAIVRPMCAATELPKTIQVAAHEEPEPLRVAPEVGSTYWIIHVWANSAVASFTWNGDTTDHQALAAGEAYATQEDAIAAYAARRKARGFA